MKTRQFTLHRLATFGDFIVYKRGSWARTERLPMYLVSRESDGRDLEEFRRKKSATRFALDQYEACSKSPTGKHHFTTHTEDMQCEYCELPMPTISREHHHA